MVNHTPIQLPLAIDGTTFEIALAKGGIAIVDAADADLGMLNWHGAVIGNDIYAHRFQYIGGVRKHSYLHRVILERKLGRALTHGELSDHKDLNTLNNRRENLRLATRNGNASNRKRQSNNTSGYKGVTFDKQTGRWRAQVHHNNKHISLGRYDTPEEAYEAYCKAAQEYFGEFARLE